MPYRLDSPRLLTTPSVDEKNPGEETSVDEMIDQTTDKIFLNKMDEQTTETDKTYVELEETSPSPAGLLAHETTPTHETTGEKTSEPTLTKEEVQDDG